MIKQLFNVKMLGAVVLSVFMMVAVSSFTSLNAQINSTAASASFSSEVQTGSTPVDLDQLRGDLQRLLDDVRNNTNYTDAQQQSRIVMYENIWTYAKGGADLEESIDLGWDVARDYVSGLNDPSSVDVKALREEARNNLL